MSDKFMWYSMENMDGGATDVNGIELQVVKFKF